MVVGQTSEHPVCFQQVSFCTWGIYTGKEYMYGNDGWLTQCPGKLSTKAWPTAFCGCPLSSSSTNCSR